MTLFSTDFFFKESSDPPLYIAPTSGNMLGGTVINVTGPCFSRSTPIYCFFGTIKVQGIFIDPNRAICIQPFMKRQGFINLDVQVGTDQRRTWHAKYFLESPSTSEVVWFGTPDVYNKNLISLQILWKNESLSENVRHNVEISLHGYREMT